MYYIHNTEFLTAHRSLNTDYFHTSFYEYRSPAHNVSFQILQAKVDKKNKIIVMKMTQNAVGRIMPSLLLEKLSSSHDSPNLENK